MELRYIGLSESVPGLGDQRVENGDVLNVKNERVAQALLRTARWELAIDTGYFRAANGWKPLSLPAVKADKPKTTPRRRRSTRKTAETAATEAPEVPEAKEEKNNGDDND